MTNIPQIPDNSLIFYLLDEMEAKSRFDKEIEQAPTQEIKEKALAGYKHSSNQIRKMTMEIIARLESKNCEIRQFKALCSVSVPVIL
jgi:hypothetical protein